MQLAVEYSAVADFCKHPSVQVAAGRTRNPGMMAWIDKVRTDLKGYDPEAPALQRSQDGQRQGGFSGPALCSCNNKCFNRTPP